MPVDVQSAVVDEEEVRFFDAASHRRTQPIQASPDAVRQAVAMLAAAERPVIVASTPAAYGDWGHIYEQFIETTKIPFMTEEAARGIVSDEHPYCFGFFDLSQHTAANLIREADVVLFLGKLLDFTIGFALGPAVPSDARVIQVEPDPVQVGRNRGVDLALVGDVGPIVGQLADEAALMEWPELPWVDRFRDAVAEQKQRLEQFVTNEVPLRSMFVHNVLANHLRPDDVLVFDGGDYAYYGRAYLPARRPRSWHYLPNLGLLGQAVPVAMAATLAKPGARVFCVTGDGAFGFNGMELDTAVRHNMKVVFLVGNDAAWGIDKNLQLGLYGKAVITDLAPSRYDLVAQGLGAYGELVERPEELEPAFERALAANGPRAAQHPCAEPDQPPRAGRRRQPQVRRRTLTPNQERPMADPANIVVYGAGAIGGQIAVRLANAGLDPTIVEPWAPQRDAIRARGLTVRDEQSGAEEHAGLRVVAPEELSGPVGVLFLCVKSYDTMGALAVVKPLLDGESLVVSMQNSINEEWIAPEGRRRAGRGRRHPHQRLLPRTRTGSGLVVRQPRDGVRRPARRLRRRARGPGR